MSRIRSVIGFTLLFVLIVSSLSFAQEGTLEKGTMTSPALGGTTKNFVVYLPPSYTISEKQYPSFYVLPEGHQNEYDLARPMKRVLDRVIQNREIGEMIAVFLDGGDYPESFDEYVPYITSDLVDHINAHYRTIPHRDSRGITGLWGGGEIVLCALVWSIRRCSRWLSHNRWFTRRRYGMP